MSHLGSSREHIGSPCCECITKRSRSLGIWADMFMTCTWRVIVCKCCPFGEETNACKLSLAWANKLLLTWRHCFCLTLLNAAVNTSACQSLSNKDQAKCHDMLWHHLRYKEPFSRSEWKYTYENCIPNLTYTKGNWQGTSMNTTEVLQCCLWGLSHHLDECWWRSHCIQQKFRWPVQCARWPMQCASSSSRQEV